MKSPDEAEDCKFLSVVDLVVADKINRCCSKEVIKAATFENFEGEDVVANQINWMGGRQSNKHSRFNEPLNLLDKEVKRTLPSIETPSTLELKFVTFTFEICLSWSEQYTSCNHFIYFGCRSRKESGRCA